MKDDNINKKTIEELNDVWGEIKKDWEDFKKLHSKLEQILLDHIKHTQQENEKKE